MKYRAYEAAFLPCGELFPRSVIAKDDSKLAYDNDSWLFHFAVDIHISLLEISGEFACTLGVNVSAWM